MTVNDLLRCLTLINMTSVWQVPDGCMIQRLQSLINSCENEEYFKTSSQNIGQVCWLHSWCGCVEGLLYTSVLTDRQTPHASNHQNISTCAPGHSIYHAMTSQVTPDGDLWYL